MSAFNKLCSSKSMKTNSLRALVKATYFKLSSCFNCQSSWFCHVNGSLFGSNISTLLASSPLLLWAVESMTAFSTFSSVNNLFIYDLSSVMSLILYKQMFSMHLHLSSKLRYFWACFASVSVHFLSLLMVAINFCFSFSR